MRFGRDTDAGLSRYVASAFWEQEVDVIWHSRDRLDWYRGRVRQAAKSVSELYPTSAISWMTHHYRKYFLVYLPEDKLIQA
jgi:hypothetical protein